MISEALQKNVKTLEIKATARLHTDWITMIAAIASSRAREKCHNVIHIGNEFSPFSETRDMRVPFAASLPVFTRFKAAREDGI